FPMRAVVVALADLGRSARMQYHAQALAAAGVDVDLIGYEGTALAKRVLEDQKITVRRLRPAASRLRHGAGARYVVAAFIDAIVLSIRLWRTLRNCRDAQLVIVQNPPAFPTLAITRF